MFSCSRFNITYSHIYSRITEYNGLSNGQTIESTVYLIF